MKKIALISLFLVCSVHAIDLKSLLGTWKGNTTMTENGIGFTYKIRVEGTARSDGGVTVTTKGTSPTVGPIVTKDVFYKNGKFTEKVVATGGFIVAGGQGTWRIKEGAIEIAGVGGNLSGKATVKGTLQAIGKGKLKYVGTSDNTKVSFTVYRL